MPIYLGADHGGFALKEKIKPWLSLWGYAYEDVGAVTLVAGDDYPVYASAVARRVAQNPQGNKGILICRSGGGMAIAANRHHNIRAVDCATIEAATYARGRNDANILTLPAEWITDALVEQIVRTFLETPFLRNERDVRRIAMLDHD